MNLKKYLLGVFVSIICLVAATAENPNFSDICSGIARHKVMAGEFNQEKTVTNVNRTIKSSGNFLFCEKGILWQTQKPIQSSLVVTERKMVQTSRNGKKTETDIRGKEGFAGIFTIIRAVLSGDEETINNNFSTTYNCDEKGTWTLALNPKLDAMKKAIEQINIAGTSKATDNGFDVIISNISVTQVGGDKVAYKFTKMEYRDELTSEDEKIFE